MKPSAKKKIKAAFFVGTFPAISEFWLIEQIIALQQRGIVVDIFAFRRGEFKNIPLKAKKILKQTVYLEFPLPKLKRLFRAIPIFFKLLFIDPTLFKRIFAKKYSPNAWSLKYLFWTAPLAGKIDSYDIIHCHFGVVGNRFLIIKDILKLNKKFIVSFYGFDGSQYIKQKGPQCYDRLKKTGFYFLPNSAKMRQGLIEIGFPKDRTIVQYLGMNLNNYPFQVREFIYGQVLHLIFVGRFVEKKGLDDALCAVAKVFNDYKKVKLHIVGAGEKGYERKIKTKVNELGIGPIVKFYGFKPHSEVINMFSQMHLMIQLSKTAPNGDTEGLPYVFCEAQACGLPVISTFHAGIPEVVQDKITGFLVHEGDWSAAAEKILFFIKNPGKTKEFSLRARQAVEQKFDINKTVNKLIEIYNKANII